MTQAQAQSMYDLVRVVLQLNENEINDAAPENFTVFVNISDILPPSEEKTPFTPSTPTSATTASPPPTTTWLSTTTTTTIESTTLSSSTSFESTEFQKFGILFFLGDTV